MGKSQKERNRELTFTENRSCARPIFYLLENSFLIKLNKKRSMEAYPCPGSHMLKSRFSLHVLLPSINTCEVKGSSRATVFNHNPWQLQWCINPQQPHRVSSTVLLIAPQIQIHPSRSCLGRLELCPEAILLASWCHWHPNGRFAGYLSHPVASRDPSMPYTGPSHSPPNEL